MRKRFFSLIFLLVSALALATPVKVGLVLAMGGLGDKSFNDSAYAGLTKAEKDFTIVTKYVEPSQWVEEEAYIDEFVANGYDLIIATSFTALDAMEDIAKKNPKVKFAIVDIEAKGDNIASLVFKENEGSFLVGAVAAQMSKSGKVGFIGGMDIPLINNFKRGYEQGAKYINPDIDVRTIYVGGDAPFNDPVRGKEGALSLATQGVDVLYHAAGNSGNGMLDAVKEKNIYGIGVDSNQDWMVQGKVLTSMMKYVDRAVYKIIKDTVEGNFKGGIYAFGIKEGGVGTTDFLYTKEIIGEKNIAEIKEIEKKIVSGEIEVKN